MVDQFDLLVAADAEPSIPSVPNVPPSVILETKYAGFGIRFLAFLIDYIFTALILVLPLVIYFLTDPYAREVAEKQNGGSLGTQIAIILLWIYFVIRIARHGQTPGKKIMKVKVIRLKDGQVPGFLRAIIRESVGKWLSNFFLLGYLWVIWDKKKQGWHDKIAGTVVIKV
jgi:uncharacterized RDD family membrane protein YckC